MRDYHDSPCDRHPSMTETLELIKCHYWWLCIGKDVLMCLNAFLVRTLTYEIFCYLGLLQPLPIPDRNGNPWICFVININTTPC